MQSFFDWHRAQAADPRPWLILGKGPSFDKRSQYDLSKVRTFSLNHVVRELPVEIAHAIDIDVVRTCADVLEANCKVLVMPWHPHVGGHATNKSLEDFRKEIPVLDRLAAQGRVAWYDLRTSKLRHGPGPVVQAYAFSSEAALALLALAGAKVVRSLGVDGGTAYSPKFKDLSDTTRLNNTQASFDVQFGGIAETIRTTGVDYAPLDLQSPIRVYVGSEAPQMLAVKVLEHSIRRHASMSVQVFPLHECGITFPTPRDKKNHPRTPFSFLRFAIPKLAGYTGRAIYLDSDMQVFRDLRTLWTQPFEGGDLLAAREPGETGRRPQFSVMLLDCERLRWSPESVVRSLDDGTLTYERLMYDMAMAQDVRAAIDPEWNSLERYTPGKTGLVHYTDMDRQPWVARHNPLNPLWVQGLLDAVADGFITRDEVAEHVQRGWVRPSLLWQVDRRSAKLFPLDPRARLMDRGFVPPYKALPHAH